MATYLDKGGFYALPATHAGTYGHPSGADTYDGATIPDANGLQADYPDDPIARDGDHWIRRPDGTAFTLTGGVWVKD